MLHQRCAGLDIVAEIHCRRRSADVAISAAHFGAKNGQKSILGGQKMVQKMTQKTRPLSNQSLEYIQQPPFCFLPPPRKSSSNFLEGAPQKNKKNRTPPKKSMTLGTRDTTVL